MNPKQTVEEPVIPQEEGKEEELAKKVVDLVDSIVYPDGKNEKGEKKSIVDDFKSDVKEREETLSYIRDVMEMNSFTGPDQLYNYWNDKRNRMKDFIKKLETRTL